MLGEKMKLGMVDYANRGKESLVIRPRIIKLD